MVKDLLCNVAMIVSLAFAGSLVLPYMPFLRRGHWKIRCLYGAVAGIAAVALLLFPVSLPGGLTIEFSCLSIIAATLFAGSFAAFISGVVWTAAIMTAQGFGADPFFSASSAAVAATGCVLLSILRVRPAARFIAANAFGVIAYTTAALIQHRSDAADPRFWQGLSLGAGLMFAFGYLAYSLILYLRKTKDQFHKYREFATVDFLTGLHNVRYFEEQLSRSISRCRRTGEPLSLICVDIDHFKRINDTFGHLAGDQVLRKTAQLLKNSVRSYDYVSRNGGEEFAILLEGCGQERAARKAEQIRDSIEQASIALPDGSAVRITISAGVASYEPNRSAAEFKQLADEALYNSKRGGRNRVTA